MTPSILEKSLFLKADAETVWRYLTDPGGLETWFHRPDVPLEVGQRYSMCSAGGTPITGEVLRAEAPEYLEYTFHVPPMGENVSTVKWRITPVAGGCKLSLIHEGLPQEAAAFGLVLALDAGWEEHFGKMRSALDQLLAA